MCFGQRGLQERIGPAPSKTTGLAVPSQNDATATQLEEEHPIQARCATQLQRRRKRSSSPIRGEEDRKH